MRAVEFLDGTFSVTDVDEPPATGVATEGATGIPTIIGYSNEYHGAFGELIVVDAYWVRRVPDGLSLEHATLAEPLHVGEMHVQQSGLTTADAALVIGCGSIGLGTILAAKAHGAHTVIAVEPSPKRRELALKNGRRHRRRPRRAGPDRTVEFDADAGSRRCRHPHRLRVQRTGRHAQHADPHPTVRVPNPGRRFAFR
jgi:threonine dehydrogenase-like Zn-dependent dehydrogenase